MKPTRSYHKDLIKALKSSTEAVAYLNAALAEGNKEAFLLALRNVLEAHGGVGKFSQRVKIHRVSLYKMFSKRGNPEFESLLSVLKILGIQFRIVERTSDEQHKKAA